MLSTSSNMALLVSQAAGLVDMLDDCPTPLLEWPKNWHRVCSSLEEVVQPSKIWGWTATASPCDRRGLRSQQVRSGVLFGIAIHYVILFENNTI